MSLRFDLTDLRLFIDVVEGGSITAGAEASHLSLAAASARVLGMEDSFGTPLLLRRPRGVEPTAAGRALHQHARTVLLQVERLRGDLADFSRGQRARVELLCNTAALHELLPEVLGDYLRDNPLVNLVLTEQPGDEVVHSVAEGRADLGIVNAAVDAGRLQTRPFRRHAMVLVAPREHPLVALAAQRPLTVADADEHDVVGLAEGTALQDEWERAVARRGRRLNIRVRAPAFEAQCRLIAAGAGVALQPESAARRHALHLPLAVLPLPEAIMQRELRLCMRRFDELTPMARRLVEHLADG